MKSLGIIIGAMFFISLSIISLMATTVHTLALHQLPISFFSVLGKKRFPEFWEHWQATGYNEHHAVRAIYQNTIDYNTTPRFDPPVPDQFVLENLYRIHAIDLWDYSTDDESNDWELSYLITSVSDSRCGVSLDDHWVDIVPQQNWLGSCDITIQVSDSLRVDYDTFRVTVVPVRGKIHLPIVLHNP